jgi:membrane protein YqaA with SNARE-associated domain
MNVRISFLLPLNGEINFRASVTLINSSDTVLDLATSATCVSELGGLVDMEI